MDFILFVFVVLTVVMKVAANVAPENPPDDLVDGWCKGGQPTRTTGECICISGECKGDGCVHSALVFYKYSTCPTCECLPAKAGSSLMDGQKQRGAKPTEKKKKEAAVAQGVPAHLDPHSSLQFGYSPTAGDENLSFEEWLEENSRIMAAVVITILFVIIIGAHIFTKVCRGESDGPTAKTN